jgi:hypothetical protein
MKKIQKIKDPIQKKLLKQFPYLRWMFDGDFETANESISFPNHSSTNYQYISVFDHLLNEEEAFRFLNEPSKENDTAWTASHHQHVLSLYDEAYIARLVGRRKDTIEIVKPLTTEKYIELATDIIGDPWGCVRLILLPQYGILYSPCYEYTNLAVYNSWDLASPFFAELKQFNLNYYTVNL